MPGYPCCCGDPVTCEVCGMDDTTTFEFDVDGDTYISTGYSINEGVSCIYFYDDTTAPYTCGKVKSVVISYFNFATPGTVKIRVDVFTGFTAFDYNTFEVTLTGVTSCTSASGTLVRTIVWGTDGSCPEVGSGKTYSVTATRLT